MRSTFALRATVDNLRQRSNELAWLANRSSLTGQASEGWNEGPPSLLRGYGVTDFDLRSGRSSGGQPEGLAKTKLAPRSTGLEPFLTRFSKTMMARDFWSKALRPPEF